MSKRFIVINGVSVKNASGNNSYFTCGGPSILSYTGFADAYRRALKQQYDIDIANVSVCPIVHEVRLVKHQKLLVSKNQDSSFSAPLDNTRYINITTSIIIGFEEIEKSENFFEEDVKLNNTIARQVAEVMRYFGAQSNYIKDVKIVDEFELINAMWELSNGYFYDDNSSDELLNEYVENYGMDYLDAVLFTQVLYHDVSKDDNKKIRMQNGLVVPSLVGYNTISKVENMVDIGNSPNRDSTPITFVEPVIGVYTLIYKKSILKKIKMEVKERKDLYNYFYVPSNTDGYFSVKNINKLSYN